MHSVTRGTLGRVMALLSVLLLSACAGGPATPPAARAAKPAQGDCGQSNWQAQTAPVINKRLGPEVLEQYDAEHPEPDQGCQ
jgi:hypothetical protein